MQQPWYPLAVPNSFPTQAPTMGLQTCSGSPWNGYSRQICSVFKPSASPTLWPSGPSVKPTPAPSPPPSAGPTQFPSSSGAINTGYVAQAWTQNNNDCSGPYPQLTLYRLGTCINQGSSSQMYTNYVPGGGFMVTNYNDMHCRVANGWTTYQVSCNWGQKGFYFPSLKDHNLPPGIMTRQVREERRGARKTRSATSLYIPLDRNAIALRLLNCLLLSACVYMSFPLLCLSHYSGGWCVYSAAVTSAHWTRATWSRSQTTPPTPSWTSACLSRICTPDAQVGQRLCSGWS